MSDVQKVPNSVKTWLKAAKHILTKDCGNAFADADKFCQSYPDKEKCKGEIAKTTKDYSKKLKNENGNKPHPAAADIRWWPWFHHKLLGRSIVFKAPDPVCELPKLPAPTITKITLQPTEPKPIDSKITKPTEPVKPPVVKKPRKVSSSTKKKIKGAASQANFLIPKLKKLGLKTEAAKLKTAKETAEAKAKGKSEKDAKSALNNLKSTYAKSYKKYKKILEEYNK
jgi:hypothetical protein